MDQKKREKPNITISVTTLTIQYASTYSFIYIVQGPEYHINQYHNRYSILHIPYIHILSDSYIIIHQQLYIHILSEHSLYWYSSTALHTYPI
jgi:hypothetical protein